MNISRLILGPVETSTPCKNVTNNLILPPIDPIVDQDESVFMEVDHHEEMASAFDSPRVRYLCFVY